ncbi:MAG TPA: aldehyde ferredoxin oxidoreductase C-terminal domain-containing protein [Thermoanaerobaculia bacterium]|jgi:aldehyde:ferredoxin oxidoreductase|nr:aldehyde ferredoxin oxidoreductase C-terminal domain-containing protein [Thermoanaerobaculia bacterium]
MPIRTRVDALLKRLASEPQFPTQGQTIFVDLERQEVHRAWIPRRVVTSLLGGRGVNMFLLHNLLDETLEPIHPDIPLIFGTGILTSMVPSASRGNVTSWSPESRVLMDSNAGDYFPSFMKLNGIDHLVLYGKAPRWTLLHFEGSEVTFVDAAPWVGLDNIDLRARIAEDFHGVEGKDYGLAAITTAGENLVLCSGIMAGPKAIYARGGPGAKMGALNLKAVLIQGRAADLTPFRPHKLRNREVAVKLLSTSVVKNALKKRGTPFLYKPSRMLGAMGTKNNQETTWTDKLDAENIDPYRPGMEGCFACPVDCRPMNDMSGDREPGVGSRESEKAAGAVHSAPTTDPRPPTPDKYIKGDGPEYVTLGKFGPNVGISEVTQVLRLNNICNDLGLDTASAGSAIAWAMELYQRGIINREQTQLDLTWGNYDSIEQLLFMTAKRECFGDAIADSSQAVATGKYPAQSLDYLMAVKGLTQSDPHDARILKAFALGLAVATRGMDHLRNRVTLEINAKINDSPDFKAELYGGQVSAEPNSYEGKEIAVRRCENIFAVGDSVGMCRFTTKLFNSPSLPGYEEFADQVANVTGISLTKDAIDHIGLNVMGVERLINARIGVTRADDTLPKRWFEEAIGVGPYKGEKIDRGEFDKMLSRFYEVSNLTEEGIPKPEWREELERVLTG